ncbi:MAG: DEAD/DEAH box helicase, partial [Nanoarchaeota archaeon]
MIDIKLRDYQLACLQKIIKTFQETNRQLVQLPTGAGKTIIFLNYLKGFSKKALILCPTRDLQEQILRNSKEILGNKNCSDDLRDWACSFFVRTSASLNYESSFDLISKKGFDTIIIDEAHRAQCKTYLHFLEDYIKINPNVKILGCTATPERLDRKSLLDIFNILSFDISLLDLINNNYLCDVLAYKIKTGEKISSTQVRNGDFTQIQLKKLCTDSRNDFIYKSYLEKCQKKKTLIFCINVEHSIQIAETLQSKGISAAFIHGKMGITERSTILRDFADGKINVLTNCQLLTEGFDEPSIEAIIIARPTASKALYFQMVGRGIRKFPKKDKLTLIELADNSHRLCTFNVLAEKDPRFQMDYPDGTSLKEYSKNI